MFPPLDFTKKIMLNISKSMICFNHLFSVCNLNHAVWSKMNELVPLFWFVHLKYALNYKIEVSPLYIWPSKPSLLSLGMWYYMYTIRFTSIDTSPFLRHNYQSWIHARFIVKKLGIFTIIIYDLCSMSYDPHFFACYYISRFVLKQF